MNLHEVNIPEEDIEVIEDVISNPKHALDVSAFVRLYNEDNLGNSIPNLQMWLYDNFNRLKVVTE